MALSTIFKKPVNRPIEGVIKADDEASLQLEVEEYVLTKEVARQLDVFLDTYNNYRGANGVWISGFFGSGKSHLLKMLALLLENRSIDGTPVLDRFLEKCGDDEIRRGDLKRAVSIPSKSILFNIDQKADVISKTQIDALLSVFVKVFDEMCGYYGKQGHIARFERDLDGRGLYVGFKQAYRSISGKDWELGREESILESQNIAQAYDKITGETSEAAMGILDKYRIEYKVSIEDFAQQVHTFIEKQGTNFRLNFFVDEVGQYIANNVKLMTNLQTIAESLTTKCRGRAWIIVTAQEDMSAVIGEMGKQRSNDFSKIQDRFANRMKLTSADVAEVIQKRLLMKNEMGVTQLSNVYHDQSNNFKTLFDFADGSYSYRNFQDREHFIHCYPFIPYQFTLFQSAIQNLSLHNAFEGRHSSVGERSMLGVFQQVAVQISEHEIGQLSTFDLMFEGVRTALKSQIQRAILTAEEHLENPFAVRVLKALFLVKYVKEFNATVRNLCVLMFDRFDRDLPLLRKDIEEALNLLEQQTYIQRNGDQYEFLTDEEKDVEEEIKNTEIESADVADELAKIIFEGTIKNRKIRYEENGQDYPFSRKLDDRLLGREYELAIHVISPFYEFSGNEEMIRMRSMGRDELLIIMPTDDRLVRDFLMYKRTEKYVRQNVSLTQQDTIKRILTDKSSQNSERYGKLQSRVNKLLTKSKLIALGCDIEKNGDDPQQRIIHGFAELIIRSYPNLRMLRGIKYTQKDIARCLQQSQQNSLFGNDVMKLSESEQEMFGFIQSNKHKGIRATLKNLVEQFERKPNGWPFAAILCTLAKLCAYGKVEVRSDANTLEEAELERALQNTRDHANVLLEPQIHFTASQVRQLKEFYENFFDGPPRAAEAKALSKETEKAFQELVGCLSEKKAEVDRYPFLSALEQPIEHIKELTGKSYTFYLTELRQQEDVLLEVKESILDPIRRFMGGSLKRIYDEARKFIQSQEPNFAYVEGKEAQQIKDILFDPVCFKGNQMQQAKSLTDSLKVRINEQLKQEKAKSAKSVSLLKDRLIVMDEFKGLSPDHQSQLKQFFDSFVRGLESYTLIAVIRDTLRGFEENEYQRLLTKMSTWARPRPVKETKESVSDSGATPKTEHKVEYVSSKSITVFYDEAWLADEVDVDRYLTKMKEAMMKEIDDGKRIQI